MISKGKKILLVEDEVVIAMDLQASLNNQGYEVVGHVTRGEDVINAITLNKPDIILMDVKLEGNIDGVDTAQMFMIIMIYRLFLSLHIQIKQLLIGLKKQTLLGI